MAKKFTKPESKNQASKFQIPFSPVYEHSDLVRFSFKYLITDNPKYSFMERGTDYFIKFLERLKVISKMKSSELKHPYNKSLRNHFIDWNDTTQGSFGLPNEDQLVDRPFQFSISVNEHGRVIGFFIDITFYFVWFDPEHHTYL